MKHLYITAKYKHNILDSDSQIKYLYVILHVLNKTFNLLRRYQLLEGIWDETNCALTFIIKKQFTRRDDAVASKWKILSPKHLHRQKEHKRSYDLDETW